MPSVSVLTVTHRPKLLNYCLKALEAQIFQDFELIVVDDLYGQRELPKTSFPILHLPPQEPKPYCCFSHAANTGLTKASGELVYFMNDAIYPDVGVLQRHWDIYKTFGPKIIISGPLIQTQEEGILEGLIYTDERSASVRDLIRAGPQETDLPTMADGLFIVPGWRAVHWWWSGRNDSAPLLALRDVGGFEELLDGHIGWQDSDLGQRLMLYGCQYLLDQLARCWEFPHSVTNKPLDRPRHIHDDIGRALRAIHYLTGEYRSVRSLLRP